MTFPDKPIAHLTGSSGPVHAVTYSANPATYILTGSSDRSIRLYNPEANDTPSLQRANTSFITSHPNSSPPIPQGRLIQAYTGHSHEVLSLAVTSDNARFASSGGDRAVFLWDVAADRPIPLRRFTGSGATNGGEFGGHTSRVNCVAFAGEGDSLVVSGGFDASVRVWDTKQGGSSAGGGRPVMVLDEARDAVTSVVVKGHEIVSGSVDGRVRTYDARVGRCVTDVVGASVTNLCLTRDGKAVLVGGLDSKVRLMDRENGQCLRSYSDSGWRNEELRVQSVLGGQERYVVAGDELTSTTETENGSASTDGRIWAWDLLTGKLVAKISVPWGPIGENQKRVIGRDGKEKPRKNVISCVSWKGDGFGDQFAVGGSSGVVTVFGHG